MWPFATKIEDVVIKPKTVRVHGVKFIIQKIDPTSFLDGSKVLLQAYDTYKVGRPDDEKPDVSTSNINKIKDHYRDVFMAAVQEPRLSRKMGTKGELYVDHLFTEWDLAHKLYGHIIEHTYGKKNSIPSI
jgi:hypothetical protein